MTKTPTTFRALRIGDAFNFGRNPESGLLADIGKPGRVVYVKTSARTWEEVETGITGRVGSINATVWTVSAPAFVSSIQDVLS